MLHFNLSDFPVNFMKQFVSLWWWAVPKMHTYLIYDSSNLMLVKYSCFTVHAENNSNTKDQPWKQKYLCTKFYKSSQVHLKNWFSFTILHKPLKCLVGAVEER